MNSFTPTHSEQHSCKCLTCWRYWSWFEDTNSTIARSDLMLVGCLQHWIAANSGAALLSRVPKAGSGCRL